MNENEQELTELDLEDILKEFGDVEDIMTEEEAAATEALKELLGDEPEEEPAEETAEEPAEEPDDFEEEYTEEEE